MKLFKNIVFLCCRWVRIYFIINYIIVEIYFNIILVVMVELIMFVMFGFIVCIRRKFCLLYFWLILFDICVVIGMVEMFVELISGLILFLVNLFINFVINILFVVLMLKVIMLSIKMLRVCGCKNLFVINFVLIDKFKKMVMMLINVFWVVLFKCFIMLFICIKLLK